MGDLYGTYRAQSPASLLHWAASAAAGHTLGVGTLLAESWAICSMPFWLLIAALRSLEWLLMRASFYSACVSFFEPRTSIILWSCNSLALEKTGGG